MNSRTYDICEELLTSLSQSEAIKAYCTLKFSKAPKFYLGIDPNNPPSIENLPLVAALPEAVQLPDNISSQSSIFIGCAVSFSDMETVGVLTKFKGLKIIEEFERLVYDHIDNFLQEKTSDYSLLDAGEARYQSFYPEFHSQRSMKIISERN